MGGTCEKCHRPLKDPESVRRGMGPICAAKDAAEREGEVGDIQDRHIETRLEDGIILQRSADGVLATNVPHVATHHSPTGYEWGYSGSGPADLALNCVEAILRRIDFHGELMQEPMWDGYRVFRASWQLHQEFKRVFIATAPRDVGTWRLEYDRARQWVEDELVNLDPVEPEGEDTDV